MYTSFNIVNFRCIRDLTIEKMTRINLIGGRNNVGKTALLEALWMHSGPNMPELGDRLSRFRGVVNPDPKRLLADIFYDFDEARTISLSAGGDWDKRRRRTLEITSEPVDPTPTPTPTPTPKETSLPPRGSQEPDVAAVSTSKIVFKYTDEADRLYRSSGYWARGNIAGPLPGEAQGFVSQVARMPPHPSAVFLSSRRHADAGEDVRRFGEMEMEGHAESIRECLKTIDKRIKGLTSLTIQTPMLYADVGLSRLVPMGFLGDGIGRYLSMSLAFYEARKGMILIDEVENGLHHSALKGVWKNLYTLSQKFDVQVFATTHSRECLVEARDAFVDDEKTKNAILYHRLERRDDQVAVTTYPFDDLDFTLDYGSEVR